MGPLSLSLGSIDSLMLRVVPASLFASYCRACVTESILDTSDEAPRWLTLLRLGMAAAILASIAWSISQMPGPRPPDALSCSDLGDPFGPKLTLLFTVIDHHRAVNDFCVFHDGRSIGRIRKNTEGRGHDAAWDWAINPPLAIPAWGHGSAPSLPEAKAAFAGAWERFYAGLTPDDIAHWRQLKDAAASRR
jgi:hypothetical protein